MNVEVAPRAAAAKRALDERQEDEIAEQIARLLDGMPLEKAMRTLDRAGSKMRKAAVVRISP